MVGFVGFHECFDQGSAHTLFTPFECTGIKYNIGNHGNLAFCFSNISVESCRSDNSGSKRSGYVFGNRSRNSDKAGRPRALPERNGDCEKGSCFHGIASLGLRRDVTNPKRPEEGSSMTPLVEFWSSMTDARRNSVSGYPGLYTPWTFYVRASPGPHL